MKKGFLCSKPACAASRASTTIPVATAPTQPAQPASAPTAPTLAAAASPSAAAAAAAVPVQTALTPEYMIKLLRDLMARGFNAVYKGARPIEGGPPVVFGTGEGCMLPALPATTEEHTKLLSSIARLTETGMTQAAFPLMCQAAVYSFTKLGADHADTLRSVYAVIKAIYQRGETVSALYTWLVPRAARDWGVGHPDTRALVVQAAMYLCTSDYPDGHPNCTRVVTLAAQQLPGGLGWGNTIVAPVPDDAAYNIAVVAQDEAEGLVRQRKELPRAKAILKHCVTFYESLGCHWLGTARIARCKMWLGMCTFHADGAAAAELALREAKQFAHRELGPRHMTTLECVWQHAECLLAMGRIEQAMSLYNRTQRLRKELLGPNNYFVFESEVRERATTQCQHTDM